MSDKIKLQLLITCGCWFIYTPAWIENMLAN
jgi:hypothetical protein